MVDLTGKTAKLLLFAGLAVATEGIVPSFEHDRRHTISAALADDDDDGDDGGGSGGSRDGGSRGDDDDDDDDRRGGSFRDLRTLFGLERETPRRPVNRREPTVPQRVPDEIVAVGLDDPAITALGERGFLLRERTAVGLLNADVVRLGIPRGMSLEEARDVVNASHPGASGDFNHYYQPQAKAPDICTGEGCHLIRQMVGWPSGENSSCLKPQKIGLIDTAINADHAVLRDANVRVVALQNGDKPKSGAKHGTAVAALLAGGPDSRIPGLLPGAEIIAVDAFQRFGSSSDIASSFDLVRALNILIEEDVKVVNLSLTGPSNDILARAVRAAKERGAFLVAAAGNDGPNAKPVFPAAYEEVIAVTAVDRERQPYRRAVRGAHIDIAAPGVGVWTAASISGARQQSGTSFAAPFVTAAVAVLLSEKPEMPQNDLEKRLIELSEDIGEAGRDPVFGWGILNARGLCDTYQ